VIVVHGSAPSLSSLVDQLVGEGIAREAIVVVRNPSGNAQLPAGWPPTGTTLVELPENRGYGAGMNAGIQHQMAAGRGLLLLLTPTVSLTPGSIGRLLAASGQAPQFGILGPVVGWKGRDRVFSYGGVSKPSGDIGHHRGEAPPADDAGIAACDWIDGAVMLIRTAAIQEIGLFDEDFFLYFEDTELALRARRSGWQVGVVLDARADEAPGSDRRPGAYQYLHARNGMEYARRAAGLPGVRAGARRHLRELRAALRRLATPGLPDRGGQWMRLRCEWRGVWDFATRRFGAPPASLAGRGDLD
jgi:GT2 family glycosyltransferase